jgi:hypothetical protein
MMLKILGEEEKQEEDHARQVGSFHHVLFGDEEQRRDVEIPDLNLNAHEVPISHVSQNAPPPEGI